MSRTYGRIAWEDGRWLISCEAHVMIRLKRFFAGIDKGEHGTVRLKDNPANARDLEWFLERFPMAVADGERLARQARSHDRAMAAVQRVLRTRREPPTFKLAIPPRRYQRVAADLALRTGRLLVADDVGLGKTATSICLLSDRRARPAVVVTLTHLPPQWVAQLEAFAPGLRVMVAKKGTPQPADEARLRAGDGPDVVVLNYHKLDGWAQTLVEVLQPKAVVFDEIQELRTGSSSGKGRGAQYLSRAAAYRMGLSATPIYNYGAEMWNILDVLEEGCLGTWEEFLREWCGGSRGDTRHAAVSEPRAFGLFLRERGLLLRRTGADVKDEVPELAKPIRIPHLVDADTKAIERVQSDAAELARIILSSTARGEDKMRASSELDWRLRQATGLAKAPYVAAFVRMLLASEEKVVLYGWHRAVYVQLADLLRDLGPVFFTGEESPGQKQKSLERFTKGAARVLVMSLRAGAGLDGLQEVARCVVFGELDWSPGVHEQCIGRLHRPGQPETVRAYFLHADHGSDPFVVQVLGIKKAQVEGVRDPSGELVEKVGSASDHVRLMAEACLQQAARVHARHAPELVAQGGS